jgi:glycerol-3-phosphate acyltransferase PlsX
MGGDHGPAEMVAGAIRASDELGVRVLLVGREAAVAPLLPGGSSRVELVTAGEVVEMHEPATAVRSKKDASVTRCAELVRDGKADAFVSAGNTGATMAAALLRVGRLRGIARPAIAVPVPVPSLGRHGVQLIVDGGSTVDCAPEWLVQFARMGVAYAGARGVEEPKVGLLSNGEEAGKGDDLRKRAFPLLASVPGFVGNVEGRDLMQPGVDVVVTDGFTGNVALKTIEGVIAALTRLVLEVLDSTPEARAAASVVLPLLADATTDIDADHVGGALLLGVAGVCVITHGSSNALAVRSSIHRAVEAVESGVVERVRAAVADAG